MKLKNIIWILISLCVFVVGRFVFSHLKEGYDQAERETTTRGATTVSATQPADVASREVAGIDFSKLDFSQNSVDARNHAEHYAEKFPPLHGSCHDGYRQGMVGQGNFEIRGSISSISGASTIRLPSAEHGGGLVTLELAVDRGTARAYLDGLNGHFVSGHVFVDASADHPGRVTGYLEDWSNSGTPEQEFVLESRNGAAKGVSYRIYRSN